MKLERSFYLREDVLTIARDLLGKVIVTRNGQDHTAGIITETEAYAGVADRASHAFGGRRTLRNEQMYAVGGTAYVYLCYGIHSLFNIVTNVQDVPHAILIRAVHPLEGEHIMCERRGIVGAPRRPDLVAGGPGKLTTALAIGMEHNGVDLVNGVIAIEDRGFHIQTGSVRIGPRIGIDGSKEAALLPYRFRVAKDHSFAA